MKNTQDMLGAVREIATTIAAKNAADVDSKARFPSEAVEALRAAGAFGAAVPRELGGLGASMRELAEMCAALAQGCGSSAMVLAMHHSQLACLTRHALESEFYRGYLRDLAKHQYLLASMTSEVGTSGDTRSSICSVERSEGRFTLNKDATTGSYCQHADAILVTCRRAADAPANDQVLVLVRKGDYRLDQTHSLGFAVVGDRGRCARQGSCLRSRRGSQKARHGAADRHTSCRGERAAPGHAPQLAGAG